MDSMVGMANTWDAYTSSRPYCGGNNIHHAVVSAVLLDDALHSTVPDGPFSPDLSICRLHYITSFRGKVLRMAPIILSLGSINTLKWSGPFWYMRAYTLASFLPDEKSFTFMPCFS